MDWLDIHREQVALAWVEIRDDRYQGGMIE